MTVLRLGVRVSGGGRRRAAALGLLLGCAALAACGTARNGADTAQLASQEATLQAKLAEPGPLGDVVFGRADAAVTVIEYASLTCPYCRQFHANAYPRLKRDYIDTGKVRYIIREFPIGRTAGAAAIVTRCAPQGQYLALYGKFLEQQSAWTSQEVRPDAIYKIAQQTGMSRETFDTCLANQRIIEGLKLVKERGRELGVVGTPTFFVNGKKASGVLTFEQIKALIEPQGS
jgi:protein-disulfide isomerase